jgi:hypothetical protein
MIMPLEIDLNDLLGKRATISIEPEETIEERTARLNKEAREHTVEMVKGCARDIEATHTVEGQDGRVAWGRSSSAVADTKEEI